MSQLIQSSVALEEMARHTLALCLNVVNMQGTGTGTGLEKWEATKHRVNLCKLRAANTILALSQNGTVLIKAWLANNGDAIGQARHEAAIRKFRENKRDVKKAVAEVRSAVNCLRAEIDDAGLGLSIASVLHDSYAADKAYQATRQMFRDTIAAAIEKATE